MGMGILRNIGDSLTNALTGLGGRNDARTARQYIARQFSGQEIEAAFEGSAMLRKAITIPATDRVRAWREWQAEQPQIEGIEAEETRHGIQAKVRQCEVLRGLGGGAMILITAGEPSLPINERAIAKGGLVAVNTVSRWHLQGHDWVNDLASPDYGKPLYWTMTGVNGATRLHPSRVVCFTAEPLPSIYRATYEDRFWGRGKVPTLLEPAQNLDEALASFGSLIKDALNVDLGVPGLLDHVSTEAGEARLMKRFAAMRAGMSSINAVVYDAGNADGKGGETISRHQVTWAGIPDVVRVYAEALAAASDIPVTRLWGTASKGLNATGEGDDTNFSKMIETGQELELRPCLDQLDVALIPSALGTRPPELWWKFAALDVPSQKSETDRFKVWTEAAEKVQMSGAIPDIAFNKAYQNGLSEGGFMPGLDGALAELPEDVRFGTAPEDDGTDPSEIVNERKEVDPRLAGEAGAIGSEPARRAANDKAQPRVPAGSPKGGEFAGKGGGLSGFSRAQLLAAIAANEGGLIGAGGGASGGGGGATSPTPTPKSSPPKATTQRPPSKSEAGAALTEGKAHSAAQASVTPAQKAALGNYAGAGFRDVNGGLRSGKKLSRSDAKDVAEMDKAFAGSRTSADIVVYRGVGGGTASKLNEGSTFVDKAFTSTSSSRAGAEGFVRGDGAAVMRIRVPKGSKALSMMDHSVFSKAEKEILLNRGGSYKVTKVIPGKGRKPPVIEVEYSG